MRRQPGCGNASRSSSEKGGLSLGFPGAIGISNAGSFRKKNTGRVVRAADAAGEGLCIMEI